jgi:hypothetical protein
VRRIHLQSEMEEKQAHQPPLYELQKEEEECQRHMRKGSNSPQKYQEAPFQTASSCQYLSLTKGKLAE